MGVSFADLRFLLLQMRNAEDPMRQHEVDCFARALGVETRQIACFDLLGPALDESRLGECDVVLLGGSGDYSAVRGGEWLERALESLKRVHGSGRPAFCSCWGFQAMARAMGGTVVHDVEHAEIGTFPLALTEAGVDDPVTGPLAPGFLAQMGHEDRVSVLPEGAVLLASSERVENQAYRFDSAPVYCTQFHPELTAADLLLRFRSYPHYLEKVAHTTPEELEASLLDTPQSSGLLRRFVEVTLGA